MQSRRRWVTAMAALICAGMVSGCGGDRDATAPANPMATRASAFSAMGRLGEKLFTDSALSASGKQSCASCHVATRAFAGDDALPVPLGGPRMDLPGLRNTPSLAYAQFAPTFGTGEDGEPLGGFFYDGRAASLAEQAQKPFFTPFEMANRSPDELLERLRTRPYLGEFIEVFGSAAVQDSATALANIGLALAQYQKEDPAFRAFSSKFDAYLRGQATLSSQEQHGLALFNNAAKGNCAACHVSSPTANTPALFTDFTYDNIGVPRNWKIAANVDGNGLSYVPQNGRALGAPRYDYYDLGLCGPLREDLAATPSRCGAFKVPTLRNAALTGPYFHNGVFGTLQEVVAWYGTRNTAPERWYRRADGTPDIAFNDLPQIYGDNVNVSEVPYIPGFAPALTDAEMADIVRFLCTLTDGFDPANPAAYRVPSQCHATPDSLAATRAGTSAATVAR